VPARRPAGSPLISLDAVVKDYRGLRPLRIQALAIDAGDRVALSGFDAAASETFVNLVNGSFLPDTGEVTVFGRSTASLRDEDDWVTLLDRFGLVTLRSTLLEGMTALQNIALPLSLELDSLAGAVEAKVRALGASAGLEEAELDRPAAALGPERRVLVHLARSLALDPEVLLLEHPTLALAPADRDGLARRVRRLADERSLTVVALTDDAPFARALADRRLRLQPGTGALTSSQGWRSWLGR
jgi:ABC-type methionine transport system ATPase subunit